MKIGPFSQTTTGLILTQIICFYVLSQPLCGQKNGDTENKILKESIRTVYFERPDWRLTYPLLRLNSEAKLTLHFDELGDEVQTYYYRFIHCSANWEPSSLFPSDYMEGFEENPVEEYALSFNTTYDYVHYQLTFPNEDVRFTVSGNYLIEVFPLGYPDEPVLRRRFMVSEEAAGVTVDPQRAAMAGRMDTHQQVNVEVNLGILPVDDPYSQIRISILQNGRWDNAKTMLLPDFINGKKLLYNALTDKNTFEGGAEFRYFDLKSIRYITEFVQKINFRPPYYHVMLQPSESRARKPYFYHPDLNGKYYIDIQEGRDPTTDADYLWVYFSLPQDQPLLNGEVHIHGALTNWALDERSRMIYNTENRAWEQRLLLKQGMYNYTYTLQSRDGQAIDNPFEGSHYETENDYLVLVYFLDPMSRYHRLIGSRLVNSLNK